MKEENENISLVLFKTEIQIQLCKYNRTSQPFFFTFSSNFLSCDSCVLIFCAFIPDKLKRGKHRELFRKAAARQNITKIVNLFTKLELVSV